MDQDMEKRHVGSLYTSHNTEQKNVGSKNAIIPLQSLLSASYFKLRNPHQHWLCTKGSHSIWWWTWGRCGW